MPQLSRNALGGSLRHTFRPPRPARAENSELSSSSRPRTNTPQQNASAQSQLDGKDESGDDRDDWTDTGTGKSDTYAGEHRIEPAIPRQLLVKLLHEHFRKDETRITNDAMAILSTYMEFFVKEAIHRAILERRAASTLGSATGMDHFLEIEDLEKLAPQLLLDF